MFISIVKIKKARQWFLSGAGMMAGALSIKEIGKHG